MKNVFLACLLAFLVLALAGCTCKHDETTVINAQEPSCEAAGYSGDTQCVKCSEILQEGASIPAAGHQPGNRVDVKAADCTHEGYTGNRVCTICGKQVETGAVIEMLPHTAAEPKGVKEPSCTEEGYSGDVACTQCGEMLQQGEVIAKLEHTPGEPEGVKAPGCTSTGFTGNVLCSVCGVQLEKGSIIPVLEHSYGAPAGALEASCRAEGYTGDQICERCSQFKQGEVIPRIPHSYDNHVCTECGWPEAGLYDAQGEMVYTWQQLLDKKIISVSRQSLDGKDAAFVKAKDKSALAGTLVISDQINTRYKTNVYISWSGFDGCENLTEVYLPAHLDKVINRAFHNTGVEKVHFAGEMKAIDVGAFLDCANLKSFEVPEGVTEIYGVAFSGCAALAHVTLPSTIKHIGQSAFENDTLITEIVFPEGLEGLSMSSFRNTGLREVVLPSTVTTLDHTGVGGNGPFSNCAQLTKIDLSQTQITRLGGSQFTGCSALETLLLPPALTEMSAVSLNGTALAELRLPQGFKTLYLGYYDKLNANIKTIYWPLSFVDTDQVFANYHFDKVYYEGSETQWKMLAPEGLACEEIVFNYVYE